MSAALVAHQYAGMCDMRVAETWVSPDGTIAACRAVGKDDWANGVDHYIAADSARAMVWLDHSDSG